MAPPVQSGSGPVRERPAGLTRRAALASLAGLAACSDPEGSYRNRVDTGWHRDDLEALLLRWHTHAVRPDGTFQLRLDRTWKPLPQAELDLGGHARLVYAFAAGHEFFLDAGYLAVARRSANFMLARFRDPVFGGFFHNLSADGNPGSVTKRADDHAFAVLALAELYRVGGDVRYRDAALQACIDIEQGFKDGAGGLYNECARDFKPMPGGRSQSPVMHMFDAHLAVRSATGDLAAEGAARRLGDFMASKLMKAQPDGGTLIPERYDETWAPLASQAAGGFTELGHQFEWSHLLAAGAAVSPGYASLAERLFTSALSVGYDETDGGCFQRLPPEGGKPDVRKGWWQQAECLHALFVAAQASGRTDLWRRYEQTQALIKAQLVDAEHGGWRAAEALPCKSGSCKDVQPDPYPMVRLHQAALKLAS